MHTLRKFRRAPQQDFGFFGGVCAGLAYTLGIPVWTLRITLLVLVFAFGVGPLVYLLCWLFVPAWNPIPPDFYQVTGD